MFNNTVGVKIQIDDMVTFKVISMEMLIAPFVSWRVLMTTINHSTFSWMAADFKSNKQRRAPKFNTNMTQAQLTECLDARRAICSYGEFSTKV